MIVGRVVIVTDSVTDLPVEQVTKFGIRILPIKILFEDKIYCDGVDLTPSEDPKPINYSLGHQIAFQLLLPHPPYAPLYFMNSLPTSMIYSA